MFAATDTMRMQVRWLIERDFAGAMHCEASAFDPWTERAIRNELRRRDVIGVVAIDLTTDRVLGYMLYRLQSQSLDVLRLAVAPEHRLHGVGRQLVVYAARKLATNNRDSLTVEVHERNLPMQVFLRAVGLRCESTRPGDDEDDRYVFSFERPTQGER